MFEFAVGAQRGTGQLCPAGRDYSPYSGDLRAAASDPTRIYSPSRQRPDDVGPRQALSTPANSNKRA